MHKFFITFDFTEFANIFFHISFIHIFASTLLLRANFLKKILHSEKKGFFSYFLFFFCAHTRLNRFMRLLRLRIEKEKQTKKKCRCEEQSMCSGWNLDINWKVKHERNERKNKKSLSATNNAYSLSLFLLLACISYLWIDIEYVGEKKTTIICLLHASCHSYARVFFFLIFFLKQLYLLIYPQLFVTLLVKLFSFFYK